MIDGTHSVDEPVTVVADAGDNLGGGGGGGGGGGTHRLRSPAPVVVLRLRRATDTLQARRVAVVTCKILNNIDIYFRGSRWL